VTRDHSINDKSTHEDKSFRSSVDERMRTAAAFSSIRAIEDVPGIAVASV
jgi:hypothetical protein